MGLSRLWPVLLAALLMVSGVGAVGSLVPLQIAAQGGSDAMMGLAGAAYFLGLSLGSFRIGPHLARVGHVRAFSALTSVATVSVLALVISDAIEVWLLARTLFGVAVGGMYVVLESWLSAGSQPQERGQILAAYLITVYGALSAGQWLVAVPDPTGVTRFAIAAGLMVLASVPLVDTDRVAPSVLTGFRLRPGLLLRRASGGLLAAIVAGLLTGAVYSIAPAFAARAGLTPVEVSGFMSAFVFGGMLLQWPIGRASDTADRRIVLAAASGIAALGSVVALGMPWSPVWLGGSAIVTGGGVFSIYAVALAYTLDRVEPDDALSANATLLLLYCLGSMGGAMLGAGLLAAMGPVGFFLALCVPALVLTSYALVLAIFRDAVDDKIHALLAPRTTPRVVELHPEFPSTDGEAPPVQAASDSPPVEAQ